MSLVQLVPSLPEISHPDVVLLHWPAEASRRELLAAEGRPRLLLLSRECVAPRCVDDLEDWVREPLDPHEIEIRTAKVLHRARLRALRPTVDEHGLIRSGPRWIDVPPVQLPVVRVLIARFGRVVSAEQIEAAYLGAGGSVHPKAVKAMIGRLKRRLAELDLVLTNVRDRGYLLECASPTRGCAWALQPNRQEGAASRQ